MLFVSSAPVQVSMQQDRKVIILMHNKIMFSHLDFIQEYLAMPLITPNPKHMYYQASVMQTVVVSQSTLEVYYCDWKTQIKLIRVIILNNQSVDSVFYEKQTGWHVLGSMMQYQPTRINFHRVQQQKNTKYLSKCYVNKNLYTLSESKLQKSEKGQSMKQVVWKDKMMVLRNCNFMIEMTGSSTLDKKRDILCINQNYILIISYREVLTTIIQPSIAYFQNNLLISYGEQGKLTTIQKYENNQFVQLGTIHRSDSEISCAFLFPDDLAMLLYEDRQIKVSNLPLVDPEQNNPQSQTKKGRKKRLFQSISRIMEQSHEEGSQFISKIQKAHDMYKHNISQNNQSDFSPASRPIVRDITANDDDIRDNSLDQGNSEVLSRSGLGQPHPNQDFGQDNTQSKGQVSFQMHEKPKTRSSKTRKAQQFRSNSYSGSSKNKNHKKASPNKKVNKAHSYQNQDEGDNVSQKSNNSKSSKKNGSKKYISSDKISKNGQAGNTSGLLNHSREDYSQTPAFGFESAGGDKWASFDKHWNQQVQDQINQEQQQQVEESICIQDAQKSLLKFVPEQLPLKIQKFKPSKGMLTAQIYNKIQKSTYCSLISNAIEEDPDKLEQLIDLFLLNVLQEAEAPLFFQKNIRTFNPQFTQDKIKKLFKTLLNNQQIKPKMTSAVQLFKLSEVPSQILCFPQDFLKVINILYKDIYIEDLLKPSQTTIDYLLQSYFSIKNFNEQIITIQDEQIDISHPRNMLNVLLYLNQYLKLKIEVIIKVYCSKLLIEDHLDILRKITQKQNIFQICQVPRSVLDDVVVQRFNQLLNQSVQNAQYIWNIIQFLSPALIDQYRIKLAIISELNKCNITFDLTTFLKIKNQNTDIYIFLDKIINENSCRNLALLKIQSIYRSLYWLQQGQKIMYVTNEYIELVKSLTERFCQRRLFYYGFNLLQSIMHKVKTSFIAKLLMNNLKCKFLNRLTESDAILYERLSFIFPQFFNNPQKDPSSFPNDKIKPPQFSKCFSCSWNKFLQIFQKNLEGPLELKVLTFCQINIVNQVFSMLDQNMKRKFQHFIQQISDYIIVQIDDINENDDSLNPKGLTSIRFQLTPKNQLQSQIATSVINREQVLLGDDQESRKKIVYKSMTLIDHYNQISSQKLPRRNSDDKNRIKVDENQDLMRIKLLVGKNQIIEQLCEIYQSKTQQIFLQSLYLVDLQKINLFHLDTFKAIANRQIQYPLSRLLPFEIFLNQAPNEAFQTARAKIKTQISVQNFWVVYNIIQLMFRMGDQVCKIFIQKCILYLRNDEFEEIINSLLMVAKPKLDTNFTTNMIQSAKGYNLQKIQKLFKQYQTKNK